MQQSAEVKIDDMVATVEVDRELDQFIKAHALGKQRSKMQKLFRQELDGLENLNAYPSNIDMDFEIQYPHLLDTPGSLGKDSAPNPLA